MELKICCDATVRLEKMSNVNNVDCQVTTFELTGDTLNGNIKISGNYIKDNLEESFPFEENVPFTLVFRDKNYVIDNIDIQDFTHQEIINQGIECNFNILVVYSSKELPVEHEEAEPFNESLTPAEITAEETIPADPPSEDIVPKSIPKSVAPDGEEIASPFIEEIPGLEEIVIADEDFDDEEIKEEINQKYDALLKEVLESRDDNFFEEETEKKVMVRSGEKKEECKSAVGNIKKAYVSYRVYYPGKENEIEKICKTEKISVEKLYNDNKDTDFVNKKRIIIK